MSNTAITEAAEVDLGFPVFLTAYDPSDLPGGSLDPLGFDRGYLLLAGKILPGLTNVADRPRYFSILCAGAFLAEAGVADPPRVQYQKRLEHILRFERFWALANVLASQDRSDGALSSSGIRGVTYASAKAANLIRNGSDRTDSDFQLLSRQVPYGVVGIYGAVAEGMRFIDRKTLTLTPDLGERLGEESLEQTLTPRMLINAVKNGTDVAISKLAEWGVQSHIAGEPVPIGLRLLPGFSLWESWDASTEHAVFRPRRDSRTTGRRWLTRLRKRWSACWNPSADDSPGLSRETFKGTRKRFGNTRRTRQVFNDQAVSTIQPRTGRNTY